MDNEINGKPQKRKKMWVVTPHCWMLFTIQCEFRWRLRKNIIQKIHRMPQHFHRMTRKAIQRITQNTNKNARTHVKGGNLNAMQMNNEEINRKIRTEESDK